MTKTPMIAALLLMAAAGAAHAGGQPGSVGVGAEYQLSGIGGASVNFDGGDWHAGGFLGFVDPGDDIDTIWQLGGRFYYHLHSTAMSDFSIGGSIGVLSIPGGLDERDTAIFLEPGIQIRLFLASNVALSVSSGIVIATGDAEGIAVTGSTIDGGQSFNEDGFGFGGGAGIHYYFF